MNKLITAAFGLLLAVPVTGQTTTSTGDAVSAAAPEDVATIDAIIAALYDVISGPAGEARDWDRFRSLFVEDAKLIPAAMRGDESKATVRFLTVDDYVSRAGPALEERGFFESEIGRVTERFKNLAHAFSTYDSRSTEGGEVFQRGINSIQLLYDGERWWIVNIMWWGVGADVEIPRKYLRQPGGVEGS